jgi:peptide/nickel transport system substrate-binding protein
MTPPLGSNRGAYANPAMDELIEAGDLTLDGTCRRAIYRMVQKLAASDLPYVPLWWVDNIVAMNRRVSGFVPYPHGNLISLATATYVPRRAQSLR